MTLEEAMREIERLEDCVDTWQKVALALERQRDEALKRR